MADRQPRLVLLARPVAPAGVVVLLHGGRERSSAPVHRHQLAVLRLKVLAAELRRQAGGRVVIARLINRVRGWNEPHRPALEDAEWALHTLQQRFGRQVPVTIIGHSLGGRVALRCAGAHGVRGVVALAPWLPDGEPREPAAGRRILIVHGTQDHTTDPAASARYIGDVTGTAAGATLVRVADEGHALMRRRGSLDALASAFALATLGLPVPMLDPATRRLLAAALSGQTELDLPADPASRRRWMRPTRR